MRLEGKSLKSDFLKFIIPSIIAQWVFSLYTMVDGIFVARGVSEVALTAVNISMPFTTGLFSISILFAVGNSTIVAILLGQISARRASTVAAEAKHPQRPPTRRPSAASARINARLVGSLGKAMMDIILNFRRRCFAASRR